MRKPLMAGNWKMFKTPSEATAFFEKFLPLVATSTHCDVVIAAPFVDLPAAVAATAGTRVEVAAQNLFWAKEGAYTGEVSGPMLAAVGCKWAIIGHSERRQFFGETDATVLQRSVAAIEAGLKPIVCVGERLEERESGGTETVLRTQFEGGLSGLTSGQFAEVAIAYEPVWAIGTGKTATPDMAAEAHRFLRGLVAAKYGSPAGASVRILYGGSVKPDNVRGLMAQPEIDGALVGGASLDPLSFTSIVNF
ncbi:MAG TPA: triose-phosphate isomerase [Bryobacteraceae bacterium]|nr:triose-phosphate isomerase [Bryobacteraceae bacterium]